MKPPCVLFLLDWRPIFWSTREEFYAQLSHRLRLAGIVPIMTVSAEMEPRVRERLEQAGAEVNVLAYNARYRRYSSYIGAITRRYNVLLAHIRFFDYFSLVPWLCRRNGIRTILFTEANSGEFGPNATWKAALLRLRTACVTYPITRAIAISEFIRQRLIASGVPPSKTCVICNGINTAAFVPEPSRRDSPTLPDAARTATFLITYLSALVPWKRPDLVIDVCSRLHGRGIPATILAGGTGPLLEQLQARTRELGLDGHLHWLGHHPNPQHLLQAADAFLHTSVGEAFGNVLAEALACGLPVVATRSGGTPEVLSEDCSILVEPGPAEADGLAGALETLARNPALRQRMGLAGRDRSCRLFSIENAVDANLRLYRELLAGRHNLPEPVTAR